MRTTVNMMLFSLILAGCSMSNAPIMMTGLSGEQSPFLVYISVGIYENNPGISPQGTLIINPASIEDQSGLICKTTRGQKEYSLNIHREGPVDKMSSFFFSFWVRENPKKDGYLKTYMLWNGYLPEPRRSYAFTALDIRDSDGKALFSTSITTHIFYNEKWRKITFEDLNEMVKKSTVHFSCYTSNK